MSSIMQVFTIRIIKAKNVFYYLLKLMFISLCSCSNFKCHYISQEKYDMPEVFFKNSWGMFKMICKVMVQRVRKFDFENNKHVSGNFIISCVWHSFDNFHNSNNFFKSFLVLILNVAF